MKHRHPPRPDPHTTTRTMVEHSEHYALKEGSPTRYPMTRVDAAEIVDMRRTSPSVRGVPTTYAYTGGQIAVWPLPAVGWEVWSVHGVRIPTE